MPRDRRQLQASRTYLAALAIATTMTAAPTAEATEGETDLSATGLGMIVLARGKGTHLGGMGAVAVRHGLTDAFDLAGELSFGAAPSMGSNLLGAAAGAHYVVDIARFRPHVGLLLGVTDLWTTTCEPRPSNLAEIAEPRPPLFACGHEVLPTATIPFALEWAPEAPIRVGLASRLSLLSFRAEVPDTLLVVGLGASFTWQFDDEE